MNTIHTIMLRNLIAGCLASLMLCSAASAATLIDTGVPDGSQFGFAVDSTNQLAVAFDSASAWRIDSVAAYLVDGNVGDHFALSLYRDAAGLPGELLRSAAVSFSADGWNSASLLAWQLPAAGLYWIGVEGMDGAFIAPAGGLTMPGVTAFSDGSYKGYQAYPGIEFGLQVAGVVPEPAAAGLLLVGLCAIGATSRHRARRKQG